MKRMRWLVHDCRDLQGRRARHRSDMLAKRAPYTPTRWRSSALPSAPRASEHI